MRRAPEEIAGTRHYLQKLRGGGEYGAGSSGGVVLAVVADEEDLGSVLELGSTAMTPS